MSPRRKSQPPSHSWRSPEGIAAIAAVATALIGVLAFVNNDLGSTGESESPSVAVSQSAGDGDSALTVRIENGSGIDGLASRYTAELKPLLAADVSYEEAFISTRPETRIRIPVDLRHGEAEDVIQRVIEIPESAVEIDEVLTDKIVVELGTDGGLHPEPEPEF